MVFVSAALLLEFTAFSGDQPYELQFTCYPLFDEHGYPGNTKDRKLECEADAERFKSYSTSEVALEASCVPIKEMNVRTSLTEKTPSIARIEFYLRGQRLKVWKNSSG